MGLQPAGMPRRMPHSGEAGVIEALMRPRMCPPCRRSAADPAFSFSASGPAHGWSNREAADHVFAGRLTDPALLGRCRAESRCIPTMARPW